MQKACNETHYPFGSYIGKIAKIRKEKNIYELSDILNYIEREGKQ